MDMHLLVACRVSFSPKLFNGMNSLSRIDCERKLFLGSMLPQYMALSVSFVSQLVSFRVSKKILSAISP